MLKKKKIMPVQDGGEIDLPAGEPISSEDAQKLFVVNERDARKRQRKIALILGFFLLTFLLPHLNPLPPVQGITRAPNGNITARDRWEQTDIAKFFAPVDEFLGLGRTGIYSAGFELLAKPFEISNSLGGIGMAGAFTPALYIILYLQLTLIALAVLGLVFSYSEQRRSKGILFMRIAAWSLIGSYLALIAVMLFFNIGTRAQGFSHTVFAIPLASMLALAMGCVFLRQIFMYVWYMYPEKVMRKEVERASVFRNLGTKECPKCKDQVIEVLESCPGCGQALAERWKCIYCKQLNTVSRTRCYSCGQPPKYKPDGTRIDAPAKA